MTSTNELAVKFFRVSSDAQDERNQVAAVDRHFTEHGYAEAREPFTLHDVSASKGEHEKELAEILSDIKAGKYTVVVIANSARIDRRDPDLQEFWALSVRMAGGRIESASEPEFGKSTISGKVVTLLAQQANYDYTKTLSKNVLNSFDRIDANGAVRGRAIYGYAVTGEKYNKRFEIIETEAAIIRESADRYLAGQSLANICRWLNDSGQLSRTGAKWSPKTLGQVLRSETIMGRHAQGNAIVKVPPILSVRVWRTLQTKLDTRAYRKGVRTRKDTAMLTSILYCRNCGRPMYRIANRQGEYYFCRPKDGVSCKMLLPLEKLDTAVIQGVTNIWSGLQVIMTVTISGHDYQDDIERIALDIRGLDPLADDWTAEVTARQAEIASLRREIARLGQTAEPDETDTRLVDVSAEYGEFGKMTPAAQRQAMLDLGFRFYVTKEGLALEYSGNRIILDSWPEPKPSLPRTQPAYGIYSPGETL